MRGALLSLGIIGIFVLSCTKSTGVVDNPYDKIVRNVDTVVTTEPDPASLEGIHKNIFVKTCANSGCHDGTFEPDFRTAESSF